MKRKYKILIGIVVLLLIIRLILPYVVLHYANKRLSDVKGYFGHVSDIDLSIYRGAYIIKDFYLNKLDSVSKKQTDFLRSDRIDLSVEWGALFHGRLVGELSFDSPELLFVKNKTELGEVKKDTNEFRKVLDDFMPLKINRFEVNNGAVHYIDHNANPKVDVSLKQTHILALNLSSVKDKEVELPSTVTAEALVYGGTLNFNMKLNALADKPTFDLNAEMKNTNLALLNDFLKAYGNFDVSKGTFGLYTEMAAKDGKFKGYVKPIIKDLEVVGVKERHDSFLHKIWESVVGTLGVILKNQKKNQLATKIPLEGDFGNPKPNILEAIWEILKNAYVQALIPNIDNEININSVKTEKPEKNLLQKIFSSGKESNKKRK